ncbi:uncharacterized protein LOC118201212 [Stegodyphus dumicola]|uniref:uncharacterized protein LOC118201212 n=1 Tax=Stegodyphus dumicola TaxID=202533 RepID=UPI0015AE7366|nr:uncharacterized protein LOC118201212 [Stegodyphus dumicola]
MNRLLCMDSFKSKSILKELYNRGIERIILYGSPVWWTGTERVRNKLLQIQRVAMLPITGCYRTVSTTSLQVLAGVTPIDLVAEAETLIYKAVHMKKNIDYCDLKISNREIDPKLEKFYFHPAQFKEVTWKTLLPTGVGLELFSDGSVIDKNVGAAFVAFANNKFVYKSKLRLNNNSTIFDAELIAFEYAIRWANEEENEKYITNWEISVFTDSQSILRALNSRKCLSAKVDKIMPYFNYSGSSKFAYPNYQQMASQ